jgi:hypothetical protein
VDTPAGRFIAGLVDQEAINDPMLFLLDPLLPAPHLDLSTLPLSVELPQSSLIRHLTTVPSALPARTYSQSGDKRTVVTARLESRTVS